MDSAATVPPLPVPSDVVAQFLLGYGLTRSCWTATYCLLVYDWFLTLDDEVEFMWHGRWNSIRMLFFLNRYWPLAYLLLCVMVIHLENPSLQICEFSYTWFIWATLLSHIVVTVIFIKRIHAMYDCSPRILALMVSGEVILLLVQTVLSGLISSATHLSPASGLSGCVPGHWVLRPWVYWIPASALETLLFSLVGIKFFRCVILGLEQYNPNLLVVLLRDSVCYFGGLTIILIGNIVLWTAGSDTFYVALSETIPVFHSIVGSRMLMNIRKEAEPWRTEPWRARETFMLSAVMRLQSARFFQNENRSTADGQSV